jgi:hypothetical protein
MRTLILASLLTIAGLPAVASAESLPRGLVRFESGGAHIHGPTRSDGVYFGVRIARVWQDDRLRLEGGLIHGKADDGFTAADVGMELRACRSACRVVPYVAVALGGINDRLGAAPMPRLSLGLDVRLTPTRLVRAGVLRSTHGKGSAGPNGFVVGFTQRFGPS